MIRYKSSKRIISLIVAASIGLSFPVLLIAQLNISEVILDAIEAKYNKHARKRVTDWQQLINTSADLPEDEKLKKVNNFFNSNVLFIDDIALWGKEDYWATPMEFLSIGAGDCEDYSIAKYVTLKKLGVPEDKLRLTYAKAISIGQAHMVLTYFENKRAIPLVLDNLITDIKPANQRPDLVPVYSFNGDGLWLSKARGEGQRVGDASRLSLWDELAKRMQQDP